MSTPAPGGAGSVLGLAGAATAVTITFALIVGMVRGRRVRHVITVDTSADQELGSTHHLRRSSERGAQTPTCPPL